MKKFWILILLTLALSACQSSTPPPAAITPSPTGTLPPPEYFSTQVPDAGDTARAYLEAWKNEDYEQMYALLTDESKASLSEDDFINHYQDIAVETALSSLDYQIHTPQVNPVDAQVEYQVTLHSALVGDVQDETKMDLILEKGSWKIKWSDTMVHSALSGDNYLKMTRYVNDRGLIYDRNGNLLAGPSDAYAFGLWPDRIIEDQVEDVIVLTSRLTGNPVPNLERMLENFIYGLDTYVPMGEYTPTEVARTGSGIGNLEGTLLSEYSSRFYFDNGVAPHVVGYVASIQEADLENYRLKGYLKDEMVGQRGLEQWGEDYLLGKRGGALRVYNGENQPIEQLAEVPSEPAQDIYTTIDKDFQLLVQRAIEGYGFQGAVVVLERDTGRVLAMASAPGFDPNAFAPGNFNGNAELTDLFNPTRPLFNRATEGQYPLGSVFKIVTMAAALESGLYTPQTEYQCDYVFDELPDLPRYDWTYDHFLEDGKTRPSGLLTLPQGLIRSCNPFFWHIGLDLYNQGLTTAISDMAKGFGLGSPTGIEGVQEVAGNIPVPESKVDAINLAIGQGNTQVTPLQVANFVAAIGNGGTLYRPQLVERIAPADGEPSMAFTPDPIGQLPVSPENLKVIQDAMTGVVASSQPRGTAFHVFNGLRIPLAGKTGTATSSGVEPHAWFAGYTFAENENKPDIAIAVVVENIGEGSDYAAPIFRRVVEDYFLGRPAKLYPWEENYYVPEVEQPEDEATPTPEGEATPESGG
jgi:penicillin-binding protein 2